MQTVQSRPVEHRRDLHLSVIAVSRNDDHGGDMRGRMQCFVNGFIDQCRRHGLDAELILVEWNPPPERPPLEEALKWPHDLGPATVRIVTVPPEIHGRFAHSSQLPLFQMIGKNVGIRRARGRFVLATNVDILLDDATVRYLRDRLLPGTMLRADRYDVPGTLAPAGSFEQVLAECDERFFRVNTRLGVFDLRQRRILGLGTGLAATIACLLVEARILGLRRNPRWQESPSTVLKFMTAAFVGAARFVRNLVPLRHLPLRGRRLLRKTPSLVSKVWRVFRSRLLRLAHLTSGLVIHLAGSLGLLGRKSPAAVRYQRSRWLHTNACGDFMLLAREDWVRLRGYPEWPIFSWHLDSALLYAASAQGVSEVTLDTRYRIYHLDHSSGSGWSPDGADQLFARLDARGIPHLSDRDLQRWQRRVADDPRTAIVNEETWGLGGEELPEQEISPLSRRSSGRKPVTIASFHPGAGVIVDELL